MNWIELSGENKQDIVDKFNAQYPPGTECIRYRLINPLSEPMPTRTRSIAWLMGGHSPVVKVEGVAGGVLIESLLIP